MRFLFSFCWLLLWINKEIKNKETGIYIYIYIYIYKQSWKNKIIQKFEELIMKVNVEYFGCNNLLQNFEFMKNVFKIVMDVWWNNRRKESVCKIHFFIHIYIYIYISVQHWVIWKTYQYIYIYIYIYMSLYVYMSL